MTVNASDRRDGPYIGNGVTTGFAFFFKVFAETDIGVVRAVIATGVTTDLVLDSDYSVALNPDQDANPGGTVTYMVAGVTTPLPAINSLTIYGNLPYTQPVDITNQGGFYPQVIEDALDRTVMLVQQNNDAVERSLQLSIATDQDFDVEMPAPVASNLLGWSADGLSLENYQPEAIYPPSLLAAQLADTTSASNGAGMVGYDPGLSYGAGTVGSALKNPKFYNSIDYATIGTSEQVTNPTFSGSPATGWTLSNFTSNNPGVTHTTGTVASASRSVTLTAYQQYQISVTLSTTTEGGFAFNVGGVAVLDVGVYHRVPVQGSSTYTFPWIPSTTGAQTLEFLSDTSWAGQVTALHVYAASAPTPVGYKFVPTDDPTERIPQGIKFGRYNAGVTYIGDVNTGASGGSDAVWNVGIGARSQWANLTGFENTSVGCFSLQQNLSPRMTALGYSAGKNNTTGIESTFLGYKSFGSNSTGSYNNGVGMHSALQSATGSFNNVFGHSALYNNISGSYHTAVGHQAGLNSRGGTGNTYLGALAGVLDPSTNVTYSHSLGTMIGEETKVYGDSGVALGSLAQVGTSASPVNNAIALGASAQTRIANTAKIGNSLTHATVSGRLFSTGAFAADSTAAGITYTVAQFVNSTLLTRTGPGAGFSDTTPTAAQIVAAIPGCEVGSWFQIYIRNGSSFTLTMLAGAGVTLSFTTTVASGQTRLYHVRVANIGSGTEAVDVVGISTAAN